MSRRAAACLIALSAAGATSGCGARGENIALFTGSAVSIASPVADAGDRCADVGDLRVCWAGDRIRVAPAPRPRRAASSALGWRCTGAGAGRACRDRAREAPPFDCRDRLCRQRHPRLPDDGEWSCVEMAGAAICRGGEAPAGVVAGPASAGWLCGQHREGQRLCVDLSPDFPDGAAAGWRCRFAGDPAPQRLCERDVAAHNLGDACDAARPCVDGAHCVDRRCVPAAPAPGCWLEADCGGGTCRFGSCVRPSP